MWLGYILVCDLPDVRKSTQFFECAHFKDMHFQNTMHYLNKTQVVYTGGIAAAIIRK